MQPYSEISCVFAGVSVVSGGHDCLCKSQGIMGFCGDEGGQSGLAAGLKNKRG
jgi:hypothetical protein